MTKVLDKATAHFRAKISGELKKITVPEWETDIYFKTSTTLKEQAKIIELAQKNSTVEALVETLIIKARQIDGSKMFSSLDKSVFMNEVDPDVLIRVVGEINSTASELDEEIKN